MNQQTLLQIYTLLADPILIFSLEGQFLSMIGGVQDSLYGSLTKKSHISSLKDLFSTSEYERLLKQFELAYQKKELVVFTFQTQRSEDFDASSKQWYDARINSLPMLVEGKKAVAVILINVTERERTKKRLTFLSFHDSLTGLGNRRLLTEKEKPRIEYALAHGHQVLSVLADIDHFKIINDTFGHCFGDKVLLEVARSLRAVFPKVQIIRFGGDEFQFFFVDRSLEEILKLARRACSKICEQKIIHEEKQILMSMCIGIGVSHPQMTYKDLVLCSDFALYQAKEHGRNCVYVVKDRDKDNVFC